MAIGVIARRLVSCSSPTLSSYRNSTTTVMTRSFASASAAAKVQDEDVMRVSGKENLGNNSTATSSATANAVPAPTSRGFLPGMRFPFGQATSLLDMMDSIDRILGSVFPPAVTPLLRTGTTDRLPWDVVEDDKCFMLRVDVPGYGKDDVKLSIDNGDLTLKAEQSAEESEEDWSSRSYGAFNARINLPENVDQAAIKAVLRNGVLNVTVPKVETSQKKLEIQVD